MRFQSFFRTSLLLASLFPLARCEGSDDEGPAACRIKCGRAFPDDPPDGGDALQRFKIRDLELSRALPEVCNITEDATCGSTFNKRTLAKIGRGGIGIGTFMRDTVDEIENEADKPNYVMFRTDASTSRMAEKGDTSFNFGMSGLCGCTLLIIISDTHVFGAHFFETLAFDNRNSRRKTNTADFNGQVLQFLENGGQPNKAFPKTTDGPSLRANVANFRKEGTRAYIMTPAKGKANPTLDYPDKIQQLSDKVNEIIGVVPDRLLYVAVDQNAETKRKREGKTELLDTERGRAMYQWDVTQGVKSHRFIFQSDVRFNEVVQEDTEMGEPEERRDSLMVEDVRNLLSGLSL